MTCVWGRAEVWTCELAGGEPLLSEPAFGERALAGERWASVLLLGPFGRTHALWLGRLSPCTRRRTRPPPTQLRRPDPPATSAVRHRRPSHRPSVRLRRSAVPCNMPARHILVISMHDSSQD